MASAMMARMSAPPDREPEQPSKFANLPFYYGWVIVGMAGLTMFVRAPAQALGLSLFVDPIVDDLELSRTVVSAMFTGGALTAAVAMIFVGRLVDRYGSRVMLTASAFFFGLAAIGMSRVEDAASLYAGMAGIRTAGQGALLLIATTMVSVWFIRLRGRGYSFNHSGWGGQLGSFPSAGPCSDLTARLAPGMDSRWVDYLGSVVAALSTICPPFTRVGGTTSGR